MLWMNNLEMYVMLDNSHVTLLTMLTAFGSAEMWLLNAKGNISAPRAS